MASTGERALSVALAMLLVVSAVGGGLAPSPVGTASAQAADTEECSYWDAFIYDFFNTGHSGNEDNPCSAAYAVQQVTDEWNETDAKETRVQIHSQAGQLKASNEQMLTVMGNSLNHNTKAWSKGEAAAVEALANGKNISQAQEAANQSIEDYYAVKQLNVIDGWNVGVETVVTLNHRAENTTGVNSDYVTYGNYSNFGDVDEAGGDVTSEVTGQTGRSISLVNDTSAPYKGLNYKTTLSGTSGSNLGYLGLEGVEEQQSDIGNQDVKFGNDSTGDLNQIHITQVRVRPSENLTSTSAMDLLEFVQTYRMIEDKSRQTKEEVAVYVEESLGPAVQNGTLDARSYVSAATLAQEYAQEYNGSDSYIRAMAVAAMSGMSTPSLENTGSMTVVHDGQTYTGLLMSQEGPQNDTWVSGQQYDPALISGVQLFAVAGENGSVVELDGPFTITEISGTDGEEIQTATTRQIVYKTSNASANYTQLQQQIRSLQEQIEERKAQATAGGSGGGSGTNPLSWLAGILGVSSGVAIVIVAGAGYVAYRVYVPDP